MNIKEIKSDLLWNSSHEEFRKNIESYCSKGLKQFKRIIRSYIFFHLFFLGLLIAEVSAFFFFLTFIFQTALIAFSLAAVLLTGFAYLILLFYFQTKKPEQFFDLRNWFMLLCKQGLSQNLKNSEYHLSLANAAYSFSSYLGKQEPLLYHFPKTNGSLCHLMRKFTNFYHKKDIQKMKEILILVSINEHIQLIKKTPTNLEAHASLANAYVVLSRLYQSNGSEHLSKENKEKLTNATKKAIQEFQIIDYYSPNDPWVHAQLASCFNDLQMYEEEIASYEVILKLCPDDKQIMFRLGILYFQQGINAKGLKIYERLRELNFSRTEDLIDFYDVNIKQEYYIGSI